MRMFPVLNQSKVKHDITEVPWDLLAHFEKQVIKNHQQTLKRLAERGGLSVEEILLILLGRPISDISSLGHLPDCVQALKEGINAWLEDMGHPKKYPNC